MGRAIGTLTGEQPAEKEEKKVERSSCPFLNKVESTVKEASQADIIQVGQQNTAVVENKFPYENFFHQQIMKKKKDHSYRVFKKVNRLAGPGQFPNAMEYSWGEKPVTVWCSNDYLGMSCHPEVKNAVRLAF